jgi:Nuclear pore complex assembly
MTLLIIGTKYYPPKNREELHRLYDEIEQSETDSLKKTCFYYYLLKDFKLDAKFALKARIPEQFCQLISGFYALDHLQFEVHFGETMGTYCRRRFSVSRIHRFCQDILR